MKTQIHITLLAGLLAVVCTPVIHAQSSVFHYQGQLTDNGALANGIYDLRSELFDDATAGSSQGALTNTAVALSSGLFTVALDFGAGVFDGSNLWLEIGAVTNGGGAFSTLTPRQPISSTPYAIRAAGVDATGIAGEIASGQIADGSVTSLKLAPGSVGEPQINTNSLDPRYVNASGDAMTGQLVLPQGGLRIGDSSLVVDGTGRVGLGKTNPAVNLDVAGSVRADGFLGNGGGLSNVNANFFDGLPSTAFPLLDGSNVFTATNTFTSVVMLTNVGNTLAGDGSGVFNLTVAAGNITGQLDNSQLADNSVTSTKIAANTITAADLANDSVGAGQIAANAVGTSAIADGSITTVDLSASVLNNTFWNLGGNAGTAPGVDFLGTTDTQPLELRVNNLRVMRFEENGDGNDFGTIPDGAPNLIGGSPLNFVGAGAVGVTIAGGGATNWGGAARANSVLGDYGAIGGGFFNTIGSTAPRTTISGGSHNSIGPNSEGSVLGGGVGNGILDDAYAATISGGQQNQILANSDHGVIGGGFFNYIWPDSLAATIAGGVENLIRSNAVHSTIGGGSNNFVFDNTAGATIAGGSANYIGVDSDSSAIGGGGNNNIASNSVSATIAGGSSNDIGVDSDFSAIGGGNNNNIADDAHHGTIAGGEANRIFDQSRHGFIGGGSLNTIGDDSDHATIAGGAFNTISNQATLSVIGGGAGNSIASGAVLATIPGGFENEAGSYAFAAGYRAKANTTGAFVWADATDADFASTDANQFLIRASGGVGINKNFTTADLDVNGTIKATSYQGDGSLLSGLDIPDGHSLDAADGSPANALVVDNSGRVGIGVAAPLAELHVNGTARTGLLNAGLGTPAARSYHYFGNSDPAPGSPDISNSNDLFVNADLEVNQTLYLSGDVRMSDAEGDQSIYFFEDGGTTGERLFWDDSADAFVFTDRVEGEIFVNTSDRNAKESFAQVNVADVLAKVAALAITTWQFKDDEDAVRHLGPVAQDFQAAFGLGHDAKHIATVDADGVALAAIQGLNQKVETRTQKSEFRIQELRAENAELRESVNQLKELVEAMNHKLNGGAR